MCLQTYLTCIPAVTSSRTAQEPLVFKGQFSIFGPVQQDEQSQGYDHYEES